MSVLRNYSAVNKNKIELSQSDAYAKFWQWFQKHQKGFHRIIVEMNRDTIEGELFDKLSSELESVHHGIFFLAGMFDAETAELIFSPNGIVSNIVYIEELIASAPQIEGWRFTALKPGSNRTKFNIEMHSYEFGTETLSFYFNDNDQFPDSTDLMITHDQYNEEQKSEFLQAIYIFLDNYLGEYNTVAKIDSVTAIAKQDAEKELIPIERLKNILILKNSEISRLDKVIYTHSDDDQYVSLEGRSQEGLPLVAILNRTLLDWDQKASHPWMVIIEIPYDGKNTNGMPSSDDYDLLDTIEQDMLDELKDMDGYLNIGRETGDSLRTMFFVCKDFRKPSKVTDQIVNKYKHHFEIEVSIFKDKYWRSLSKFG